MMEHERRSGHVADESRGESGVFRRLTRHITAATGSPGAAAMVVVAAAGWLVLGAITDFPRWWELLATGGVPFLTLLMVVLIQHTQNHDDRATQLKLDELIRATHSATNRMMTVEDAGRADLDRIHDNFQSQAESAAPEALGRGTSTRRPPCGLTVAGWLDVPLDHVNGAGRSRSGQRVVDEATVDVSRPRPSLRGRLPPAFDVGSGWWSCSRHR